MLKIDLHVHTDCSPDSMAGARRVLDAARSRGLSAIAVTDHDTAEGGLKVAAARRDGDPAVIPGVELTVPMGRYGLHIIGLFVTKAGKPEFYGDAVRQIREQKGVVMLPHLFREGTGLMYHLKEGNISRGGAEWLLAAADYVEGLNYKSSPGEMLSGLEFLRGNPKPVVAGTDAHVPAEIGLAWTEVEDLVEFKRGTARTAACMMLRGPAPVEPRGRKARRAESWFSDLMIGCANGRSGSAEAGVWRSRVRGFLKSFPISLAGEPLLQYYKGYKSAMAEDRLSRRIESELGGAFEAVLKTAQGRMAIEPREGSV